MDHPILAAAGLLAVVLLVLAGACVFTRWAGKSLNGSIFAMQSRSGRVQVLDRAALGRDQALLVVRAGERYLLLGSSPAGLTLLTELTREEGENWIPPASPQEQGGSMDFRALMRRLREKN